MKINHLWEIMKWKQIWNFNLPKYKLVELDYIIKLVIFLQ